MRVVEVEQDTCDACPTEAYVEAFVYIRMPSGRGLSMCCHHAREHNDALVAQGAVIIDQSYRLEDK